MSNLIDGKAFAENLRKTITEQTAELEKKHHIHPADAR